MYALELVGEDADEPLAVREAAAVCDGVRRLAPGVATARSVGRTATLAFTRRTLAVVATSEATVSAARRALAAAPLGELTGTTAAVRARDVRGSTGVSTAAAERRLGGVLTDAGFEIDLETPDRQLRAVFASPVAADAAGSSVPDGDGVCVLGWVVDEPARTFAARAPPNRPFVQPGSMAPLLARAAVNVAGAAPGRRLLDPLCGTGGTLIEAAMVGATTVGVDAQWKMVRGTHHNLVETLASTTLARTAVVRGDAARLPFATDAFDGVVADLPYGRQSPVLGRDRETLVAAVLEESRRMAPRAVVIGDRSWTDVCRQVGWRVERTFERRVHRSMTRHLHVLTCE